MTIALIFLYGNGEKEGKSNEISPISNEYIFSPVIFNCNIGIQRKEYTGGPRYHWFAILV
jgi:hypothetical protein